MALSRGSLTEHPERIPTGWQAWWLGALGQVGLGQPLLSSPMCWALPKHGSNGPRSWIPGLAVLTTFREALCRLPGSSLLPELPVAGQVAETRTSEILTQHTYSLHSLLYLTNTAQPQGALSLYIPGL